MTYQRCFITIAILCHMTVWSVLWPLPLGAQETPDTTPAVSVTTQDPLVQEDELALMLQPLTKEELEVEFICRPWVKTENYWAVYWDVTQAVKEWFDREGISIPFPQRDVHLYHENVQAIASHDTTSDRHPAPSSAPPSQQVVAIDIADDSKHEDEDEDES